MIKATHMLSSSNRRDLAEMLIRDSLDERGILFNHPFQDTQRS